MRRLRGIYSGFCATVDFAACHILIRAGLICKLCQRQGPAVAPMSEAVMGVAEERQFDLFGQQVGLSLGTREIADGSRVCDCRLQKDVYNHA